MNRVLIVDDKPENLYLLRALLQGHGFVVEEASHGAEALVKARQALPSLLISDLLMPVMDGYSLLKHWKSDERLKIIPFVVYTATYTDPKDERLALNLGADAFILKPAEPEPFMARIREVLARQERGELPPGNEVQIQDTVLFEEYSQVLVRKLEDKIVQLEQVNGALREEIAGRKRAEGSLKLFRTLLDHSNDKIEVIDLATGRFLDMNQKGCETLGYGLAEILRLDVTDVDLLVAELGWAKVEEQVRSTGFFFAETQHRRKDGTVFPVEVNAKLVQLDRDYLVAVVRDVTERKKSEEALRQSEDRFRQAQKMEAIGQLASGVAHDFNNMLTIISGYSELLLSRLAPNDPMCEDLNTISQAGYRAASLTRQLLAFSRKTVLEPKVLDLNEVVGETEKFLRRLIGEDVLFTAVLDPTISRVKVDPDHLGQVLVNLAVNARDAMPKGGKLTIETRTVELDHAYAGSRADVKAGQYVLLSMTDTGTGMSAEVKAHLFEPFFTTKSAGKGTGLGLAVVLGIVKQSGGHVEVYSELDIGTTFKLYFPAVEEQKSTPVAIDASNGGYGTETVLLVEDEDGVRGLAMLVLHTYGYKVMAAGNGKEALRLVEKHQDGIDLLVADVVMPGMGGPDLAEALRPLFPRMKVLFCSGYTDDAVIRNGLVQETVAFLQKPYRPLALARKVRQVLDEN